MASIYDSFSIQRVLTKRPLTLSKQSILWKVIHIKVSWIEKQFRYSGMDTTNVWPYVNLVNVPEMHNLIVNITRIK